MGGWGVGWGRGVVGKTLGVVECGGNQRFTGFYWAFIFDRVIFGLYWVLLGLMGFPWVFTVFFWYWVT